MIEGIGEVTAQQVTRAEQQAMVAGQENAHREISRKVASRPVEEAADSQKQKAKDRDEAKTEGKYNLEYKFPVYEKYNQNGELILQVPPVHDDEI